MSPLVLTKVIREALLVQDHAKIWVALRAIDTIIGITLRTLLVSGRIAESALCRFTQSAAHVHCQIDQQRSLIGLGCLYGTRKVKVTFRPLGQQHASD
jgi:hypothetical protein